MFGEYSRSGESKTKDSAERIISRGKSMKIAKSLGWILLFIMLIWIPISQIWPDGGYVSKTTIQSIAVSADQRAIIIKDGGWISMTFSTGYTGEGDDFGWIIPTPVPPAIEHVGERREAIFDVLDEFTAPVIITTTVSRSGGGCFPAGTEVLTADGPRVIESVGPGVEVYACDLSSGEWTLAKVHKQRAYFYEGDMITVQMKSIEIQATGNHPFYVSQGDSLASRPLPQEIPEEEHVLVRPGRWVEARDLKAGDVVEKKNGGGLVITNLSSRVIKTEVYHLEVEHYHNYAVHRMGILVHNGGKRSAEKGEEEAREPLVTVYGKVTLEHYEVTILGAADVSALFDWLQENDYQVNPSAQDVLDSYIDQNWAFVAVKLNPSEKRRFENEFLPPFGFSYQHDQLIFPLRISSISTTQNVRITLFVIADSTVTSSNFPTTNLKYDDAYGSPEYIEAFIRKTVGREGRGLAVMWSGALCPWEYPEPVVDPEHYFAKKYLYELCGRLSPQSEMYLTRLETRINPAAMTEDIQFILDPQPYQFQVQFQSGESRMTSPQMSPPRRPSRPMHDEGKWISIEETVTEIEKRPEAHLDRLLIITAHDRDGEVDTLKRLIEAGADVDARDLGGLTALMLTVRNGHTEIVKVLLEAGADINAQDDSGETALLKAARGGQTEVVNILVTVGADVNAKNKNGDTALILAIGWGHTHIVDLLKRAGAEEY